MNQSSNRALSDTLHSSEISLITFFVFFGLLSGIILRELQKKIKIPYTPVLLILGLLVSLIGKNVAIIGEATSLVSSIDPSGILLIFIPILIFESSFKADWHVFKRSMRQILLLAGPGLAISFALVAVAMKCILGYDDDELSWSSALMFGAIVAATDPVAIVALLKSLGAPHYFSTIVEGESLLNDGTGVVFFTIFANVASGKEINVGLGIGFFLFLCFGGVALGFIFSLLTSSWLEKIFNDSVLSISITITASYLLFWVAETFRASFTHDVQAGVSGILALCTLGLFLSAYAKTKISSRVEHPLHAVIQWAQYVSETLIFLLTGIIVGKVLFNSEQTIGLSDWIKLIIFYVLLNVIRVILVAILVPLLNRSTYKMNLKELFILSYAGLRGALGLSLALTVHDDDSFSRRTRELVLFYVSGTAALTLLINGTTTGFMMRKIKMIKEFPIKKKMHQNFIEEVDKLACQSYEKLRVENPAAICDWESVRKILKINSEVLAQHTGQGLIEVRRVESEQGIKEEELKAEARYKMLHAFKELVWERHEKGELESYGANTLNKAVNISLDDLHAQVNIFEFLYTYFVTPKALGFFLKLLKVPLIGRYFKRLIIDQMVFIYDVTTSLVDIIEDLKNQKDNFSIPDKSIMEILSEFEKNQNDAVSYLNKLEVQFLDIITYITSKRYVTKVLMSQKKFITERYELGAIETLEYEKLTHDIEKKIHNLPSLLKIKWEPPSFHSLILRFPVFNMLSEEQIKRILTTSKKVKLKEGDYLFKEGESFNGIFLITKGEVEINYKDYKTSKRGVGRLISFFNLVTFDNVSRIDCKVTQKLEAQKINIEVLRDMMEEHQEFEENAYRSALGYLRFMDPEEAKELVGLTDVQIKAAARSGEVIRFMTGKNLRLPCGGFVFRGILKRGDKEYGEYSMIPKNSRAVIAQSNGMLIKFNAVELGGRRGSMSPIKGQKSVNFGESLEMSAFSRKGSQVMMLGSPSKRRMRIESTLFKTPIEGTCEEEIEIEVGKEEMDQE